MSATTIAILNMKGGVGKTTITTNIAVELFNRGNRVLVIDIDPQFNSTQTLVNAIEPRWISRPISSINNLLKSKLMFKISAVEFRLHFITRGVEYGNS